MTSFTWMFGSRLGAPKLVTLLDLKIPEKSDMIGSRSDPIWKVQYSPIQRDHASAKPPALPCPDFLPEPKKKGSVQLKVKQENHVQIHVERFHLAIAYIGLHVWRLHHHLLAYVYNMHFASVDAGRKWCEDDDQWWCCEPDAFGLPARLLHHTLQCCRHVIDADIERKLCRFHVYT